MNVSHLIYRRRGDNAPIVKIGIKGNEKDRMWMESVEQKKKQELKDSVKSFHKKTLMEERNFFEEMM